MARIRARSISKQGSAEIVRNQSNLGPYSVRVGVVSQASHRARKYLNVSDGAPPATYQLASDWLKSAGGSLDLSASHVAGISSTQPRNAANQQQFVGSTRRQRVDKRVPFSTSWQRVAVVFHA